MLQVVMLFDIPCSVCLEAITYQYCTSGEHARYGIAPAMPETTFYYN